MFTIQASVEIVDTFDTGTTAEYPSVIDVEVTGRNLSEELVLEVARHAISLELGCDMDELDSLLSEREVAYGPEGSKARFSAMP